MRITLVILNSLTRLCAMLFIITQMLLAKSSLVIHKTKSEKVSELLQTLIITKLIAWKVYNPVQPNANHNFL